MKERANAAVFSSCGVYRYWLTRDLRERDLFATTRETRTVTFCMLNPSTATAEKDDPTIRRCKGYAFDWGYNHLIIVNMYAYRATDPMAMWRAHQADVDIIGLDNDREIIRAVQLAGDAPVVCAWGTGPKDKKLISFHRQRQSHVLKLVGSRAHYLELNISDGSPKHPLYLAKELQPMKYRGPIDG